MSIILESEYLKEYYVVDWCIAEKDEIQYIMEFRQQLIALMMGWA